MKYLLLRLLPKNILSRLAGRLADMNLPSPVLSSLIQVYCRVYDIKQDEMKRPASQMKTFNEFFTRELKSGARPIDKNPESIVSPVDGAVAEFGKIEDGLLVQTKGILYSLVDFVGKKDAKRFQQGYFLTIYLSPADYHRIHSPVTGNVEEFSYFSGNLWPVNNIGVTKVGGVFSINERIVTLIQAQEGAVALIKVGATIVGKIKVDYSDLTTNSKKPTQLHLPVIPSRKYEKGDEIGRFQLGSTVILLFEENQFLPVDLYAGKKLKMGQIIGNFSQD